jgi:hypothetical protein
MRRSWLISAVLVAASSVACTALLGDFTVDGSNSVGPGAEGGTPGECTATQKTCNGACVPKDAPLTGCATTDCAPCAATTNSAPACKAGACSFTCNQGFSDCDGNPANGCEAKTFTDVANCGTCGDPCGATNTETTATCAAGKCAFACKVGFGHCGATNASGCETKLLDDPANCGACGHSCLGGACKGGKCEPFQLASASQPSGLAVDKTHVYFTAPSLAYIQRVQRDGKCAPAAPCPQDFVGAGVGDNAVGPQVRGPTAVVSDGATVIWTANAAGLVVKRAAVLPAGPLTTIGNATSTNPGYLALGGGKIWWTTGFGNADPAPHVRGANLDGTGLVTIANFQTPVNTFKGTGGIAADATAVYWASQNGGVYRAAFNEPTCNEGSVTAPSCKQFGSSGGAYGVAVDDNFVYWTEPTSGVVKRAAKTGGQSTVIASGQDYPQAIAVLGTFVYWGNAATTGATAGTIRRAPQVAAQCIGVACEHVADAASPDSIIAADAGIYWTNNTTTGGVYRLAK